MSRRGVQYQEAVRQEVPFEIDKPCRGSEIHDTGYKHIQHFVDRVTRRYSYNQSPLLQLRSQIRLIANLDLVRLWHPIHHIRRTNLDQCPSIDDTLVRIGRVSIFFDTGREGYHPLGLQQSAISVYRGDGERDAYFGVAPAVVFVVHFPDDERVICHLRTEVSCRA